MKYGLKRIIWMPSWQGVILSWLIVCVNLTGLQDAQTFGQTLFGVCLRIFPDEIHIWISKPSRLLSLVSVGLMQPIEDLNRTKKAKRECLLPDCLSWDIGLSWPLDLNWNISSSWALNLPAFRLEFIPWALLVQRPSDMEWSYTLALGGLQLETSQPP